MTSNCRKGIDSMPDDEKPGEDSKQKVINYRACDNSSTLYTLNLDNDDFKTDTYKHETSYIKSRPYFIKRIPRSNLLLVVVNSTFPPVDPNRKNNETTEPVEIVYDSEFPCHKLNLNDLPRRRLEECFTEHPDVSSCAELYFGGFLFIKKKFEGFFKKF